MQDHFQAWVRDLLAGDSLVVAQQATVLAGSSLAWLLAAHPQPQAAVERGFAALQPALDLIEERYATPLALADLSASLRVSPQFCARLFRRHLGETPIRYLIRRWVAHAVEQLSPDFAAHLSLLHP